MLKFLKKIINKIIIIFISLTYTYTYFWCMFCFLLKFYIIYIYIFIYFHNITNIIQTFDQKYNKISYFTWDAIIFLNRLTRCNSIRLNLITRDNLMYEKYDGKRFLLTMNSKISCTNSITTITVNIISAYHNIYMCNLLLHSYISECRKGSISD